MIGLEPLWGFGHYFLGTYLATSGRLAEARASLERAIELDGRGVHYVGWLGMTHALAGREAEARECLEELVSHERQGRDVAVWKLHIHVGLGDADGVMRCLEQAYDERSSSLIFLLTHPLVDCLRGDARFDDLLRRMGLEHLASYRPKPAWKPLQSWREL